MKYAIQSVGLIRRFKHGQYWPNNSINKKMKKDKIYDKLSELHQEIKIKEEQIRVLVNDSSYRDYPKIKNLCDSINIYWNQILVLEELIKY